MLLLETANRIVENTLVERIAAIKSGEKPDTLDITAADFDGVQFHITTPDDNKGILHISIQSKCGAELLKYGKENLKSIYGALLGATESGYDVTLIVDLNKLSEADSVEVPKKVSLLKRHLLAGVFLHVF